MWQGLCHLQWLPQHPHFLSIFWPAAASESPFGWGWSTQQIRACSLFGNVADKVWAKLGVLKVCFQLSSSQKTMDNYSLILIPYNLVCINHISHVKTRTKRKFQFLHSSYWASNHYQHRCGNDASFWRCIDKHLFELNSKLKISNGNMPNIFVCNQ